MDKHDPIHYGLHAVVAVAVGGLLWGLAGKSSIEDVAPVYHASASALSTIPFEKTTYHVLAAPGSGILPLQIADAIRVRGGTAIEEGGLLPQSGNYVSPDTPSSHAIADALARVVNEPVAVINDGSAVEISIGTPTLRGAR